MKHIPMKPSSINTEQINLRIDKLLKDDLDKLKYLKVDVGNLIREAVRQSVEHAFEVLQAKPEAS